MRDRRTKLRPETVKIDGETVVVSKAQDVEESGRKRKVKPWVAECIGMVIKAHGDSRTEVLETMGRKIDIDRIASFRQKHKAEQ